ncbi:MAG: hypothetical protein MJ224_00310 [archaeon]|nr:hypothetical protein [archaeon]
MDNKLDLIKFAICEQKEKQIKEALKTGNAIRFIIDINYVDFEIYKNIKIMLNTKKEKYGQ